jgi:hypothetical protein
MSGTDDWDSYADRKLRAAFVVKGLSRETMDAVHAGELEIVEDDPQSELLKEINE